MQYFPHACHATADAVADGDIQFSSDRVPGLRSASPAEFGGPADRWSPETLLSAAVADCFILTFRAVAGFELTARLDVPEGTEPAAAEKDLKKAERSCLISSSLKGAVHLHAQAHVEPRQPAFG